MPELVVLVENGGSAVSTRSVKDMLLKPVLTVTVMFVPMRLIAKTQPDLLWGPPPQRLATYTLVELLSLIKLVVPAA